MTWEAKALSEVVELRRGFDLPHAERQPGDVPILSAGQSVGSHNVSMVEGPGFAVGRATNLGVPTWSDRDYWPLNTTLYAADFKGNDPAFLFRLFQALDLRGFDSGSVQPMLNRNYIAQVPVRIPALTEQRAIAEVLGALDDKIAANEQVIRLGRELTALKWQVGISGGSVPRRVSLNYLSQCGIIYFSDGYRTKAAELTESGFRIIRVADVEDDRVDQNGSDWVSGDRSSHIGLKAAREGDVLVTTKGTVGRVAIMPAVNGSAVYSPQLCFVRILRPELVDASFVREWFASSDFQMQASIAMHNTDMAAYINLRDLGAMELPWPSDDQRREIGAQLAPFQRMGAALRSENDRLAALRDVLLPELMSGRLRVKDAEKTVEEVV